MAMASKVLFVALAGVVGANDNFGFDRDGVTMAMEVDKDCNGKGIMVVQGLGGVMPSLSVQATFTRPSCGDTWTAEGPVANVRIPLMNKVLEIRTATVRVHQFADGQKAVALKGRALEAFDFTVEFPLPFDKAQLKLDGFMDRTKVGGAQLKISFLMDQHTGVWETALDVATKGIAKIKDKLSLPPTFALREMGAPFIGMDGKLASTCSFEGPGSEGEPLVLTVPGMDGNVEVQQVMFDACVLARSSFATTTEQFLFVEAGVPAGTIRGLSVTDLHASVTGSVTVGGVKWAGSIAGSASLMGGALSGTLNGEFDDSRLSSLQTEVAYEGKHLQMAGWLEAGVDCAAVGNVQVTIPGTTIAVNGDLESTGGCGAGQEWFVKIEQVDPVTVRNITIEQLTGTLVLNSGVWAGDLTGSVALKGLPAAATATVSFESGLGVTKFMLEGNLDAGAVTGIVSLTVEPGSDLVVNGQAELEVTTGAGEPSKLTSVVEYRPLSEDLWTVEATLTAPWVFAAVPLTDVYVAFQGRADGAGGVVWSGQVDGEMQVGPSDVSVRAAFVDGKFQELVGDISLASEGLTFYGVLSVEPNHVDCASVEAKGQLQLAGAHDFAATATYHRCASQGEVQFTLEGTANGNFRMAGLNLTSATATLEAIAGDAGSLPAWGGHMSATADLFGGSSVDAELQPNGEFIVTLSTKFMTRDAKLSGAIELTIEGDGTCKLAKGTGSGDLRFTDTAALAFSGLVEYDMCTGVLSVDATADGEWSTNTGTKLAKITVVLRSSGNEGEDTRLAVQTWSGMISGETDSGVSVDVEIDESALASGSFTIDRDGVTLTATVDKDCNGDGTLIVHGVDGVIPTMELDATFSRPSCGDEWTVEGTIENLRIPLGSKVLILGTVTVRVDRFADGKKAVMLKGSALSKFVFSVEFPLPFNKSQFKLTGSMDRSAAGGSLVEVAVEKDDSTGSWATTMNILTKGIKSLANLKDKLSLPPSFSLKAVGLPFMGGADEGLAPTCPFEGPGSEGEPLVLTVPGMDGNLEVRQVMFDACVLSHASSASATEQFLVLEAGVPGTATIRGLSVTDLHASVTGSVTVGGVKWAGSIAGSASLMNDTLSGTLKGEFDDSKLLSLQTEVAYEGKHLQMAGWLEAGEDCDAVGNVQVTIPGTTIAVNGDLESTGGCGADQEWYVKIEQAADPVTVRNMVIEGVTGTFTLNSGVWAGDLTGSVALKGLAAGSTAAATVSFESGLGVTNFVLEGNIESGAVTGIVSLTVEPGSDLAVNGQAELELAIGAGEPSKLTAVVEHRPLSEDLWTVRATLTAPWVLFEVPLADVVMEFEGRAGSAGGVVWSGSVDGVMQVGPSDVSVRAEFADGEFQHLVGNIALASEGLTFDGEVLVEPNHVDCAALTAQGQLQLAGAHDFAATVTYQKCVDPGEVQFAVEGTADGSFQMSGLTLTSATATLEAIAGDAGAGLQWGGRMSATANLFGGSSTVEAEFKDGQLDLRVNTRFMTSNGKMEMEMDLLITTGQGVCTVMEGTALGRMQVKLNEELNVEGQLTYDSCTAVATFDGRMVSGTFGGDDVASVTVYLETVKDDMVSGDTPLAQRVWIGTLRVEYKATAAVELEFDSSSQFGVTKAAAVYETDNLKLTADIDANCRGQGTLIVRKMDVIPAIEASVSFEKPCNTGTETKAWTAEGTIKNLMIPFKDKVLNIRSVVVRATRDEAGVVSVSINGDFQKSLTLGVEFTLPFNPNTLLLTGKLRSGASIDPDEFGQEWTGESQFSNQPGVAGVMDALRGIQLVDADLGIRLVEKTIVLKSTAVVFGVDLEVGLIVSRATGRWNAAIMVIAEGTAAQLDDTAPEALRRAFEKMQPERVVFSLALQDVIIEGLYVHKGLRVEMQFGNHHPQLQQIENAAPAELATAVRNAHASGVGLTLSAHIRSLNEFQFALRVGGDMQLGQALRVHEIFLAVVVGAARAPEFGFLLDVEFSVGKNNGRTFKVVGFFSVSATGTMGMEVSVESNAPWEKPLGIPGVRIDFPLALGIGVSPALVPTKVEFIGKAAVAGTEGSLVLGMDMQSISSAAFSSLFKNLKFGSAVKELTPCKDSCQAAVSKITNAISVEEVRASFNPSLSTVSVVIGAVSRTIPAGIVLDITSLRIWKVIHVRRALVSVTKKGVKGLFEADPIKWGPLTVTSATSATKGPQFDLELTMSRQAFIIDGRVTIFGAGVALKLHLSNAGLKGEFEMKIAGFAAKMYLEAHGLPGSSSFYSEVRGSISGSALGSIIGGSTSFLSEAEKEHSGQNAEADKVMAKLNKAKAELDAEQKRLDERNKQKAEELRKLRKQVTDKENECKGRERDCKRNWTKCFRVAGCKSSLTALKARVKLDEAKLTILKTTPILNVRKATYETHLKTYKGIKSAMGGFDILVAKVGKVLSRVLTIHSLTMKAVVKTAAAAEAAFSADLTIFGERRTYAINAYPTLESLTDSLKTLTKSTLKRLIPKLKI